MSTWFGFGVCCGFWALIPVLEVFGSCILSLYLFCFVFLLRFTALSMNFRGFDIPLLGGLELNCILNLFMTLITDLLMGVLQIEVVQWHTRFKIVK